ncbi:MAG: hypothetical protein ABSG84_07370 [Acidobacteriaceae bacterium]|jgi:hypothetical protein
MNRSMIAVAILSLAFPLAGIAQSTMQTASLTAPLSAREAHDLIRSAHSRQQYQQLASYYHQQEANYRAEAVAEKAERDRRAQVNAALMQKYPRPVDSAQYLYESYVSQADNAALQARHYDQLAAAPAAQNPQSATDSQGKS